MAIENVQRNSTGVVKVVALDAIGNVLPEFNAAASDIVITDGTNNYAVTSASWSNGTGLLNVTTPNVTGLKTLTLSVKGSATTLYPDPFQINLVDPYSGRFNTTGGEVIWDMRLDGTGTQTQMVDYSGRGGTGLRANGAAFDATIFTNTSQYVAGTAAAVTLGQYRYGVPTSATGGSNTACGVRDTTRLDALTKDVTLTNLPIKSVNMIVWRSTSSTRRHPFFMYRFIEAGGTFTRNIYIYEWDDGIRLGVRGTTLITIARSDAQVLWNASNKIAFIGATWSISGGNITVTLRVNGKSVTTTAALPSVGTVTSREFNIGNTDISDDSWWGSGPPVFAWLDSCAYGDEKNADFFRTNAAAWGL